MKIGIVILAGGKGERFHGKKQILEFHGKPLWKHVYDVAMEVNEQKNVVIVGRSVEGGKTRSESVINGLKALDSDTDRVVIMEAARPLVTTTQVRQLVK